MTKKEFYERRNALEREYYASLRNDALDKAERKVIETEELLDAPKAEELLNKEDFEKYVSVNTSKEDLKAIFVATDYDLDHFCRKTYGLDFKTAYFFILKRALAEYKSCLSDLAGNGNATAMNTINQLTLNMSQQNDVKIKVIGTIPTETKDGD